MSGAQRLRQGMRAGLAIVLIAALVGLPSVAGAQPSHAGRPEISRFSMAPDGASVAYVETAGTPTAAGAAVLVVRNVESGRERRFPVDPAAMGFSPSGRWLAFAEAGPGAAAVTILDTRDQSVQRIDGFRAFTFFEVGGRDSILTTTGPSSAPAVAVRVEDLEAGTVDEFNGIAAFALSPTGDQLAWTGADGLHVYSFSFRRHSLLPAASGGPETQLHWSPDETSIAYFATEGPQTRLIVADLRGPRHRIRSHLPRTLPGFPDGYEFAPSRLMWRDSGDGLLFDIRPPSVPPRAADRAEGLAIWHWRDPLTPMQRATDRRPFYLSYLSLAGRFVRLADQTVPIVEPHPRADHLLAYYQDPRTGYVRVPGSDGVVTASPTSRDYFLIDIASGRRTPFLSGLRVIDGGELSLDNAPRLSPSGETVLYQHQGDWFAYDVRSGGRRNLTAGLPARFFEPENDRNQLLARRDVRSQPQGWSGDGRFVLLSDNYDVWALPLRSGVARNLTGNGRREEISYTRTRLRETEPSNLLGDEEVDLNAPVLFRLENWRSGESGLAEWDAARQAFQTLHSEPANVFYIRASRSEQTYAVRSTSADPTTYLLVDQALRPEALLARSGGRRQRAMLYLTYASPDGIPLHARLFPPTNRVPGRPYPTVVSIYEQDGRAIQTGMNDHDFLLDNGYALLVPDIVPRINAPGTAAVEHVRAGIEAAVRTGIVDPARLALFGHSFGAYETLFVITRTNMFRAAIAEAGPANLISWHGGLNQGRYAWRLFQTGSQPFVTGAWWENWQSYFENSPLFQAPNIQTPLLLMHDDDDPNIALSNSLELFTALHRLGDRPVVMLQYSARGHNVLGADDGSPLATDTRARMLQFLNHYVLEQPAPDWLANGRSIARGQVPSERLPAHGSHSIGVSADD